MDWSVVTSNLLTPPILFFALGMAATLLRSDLEIPQQMTRAMSLYLLFSIGMHGGVELGAAGFSLDIALPLVAGMAASAFTPIVAFLILRKRVGAADAAGIGACYGSISAVTFVTACSFLDGRGTPWSGSMVAAMALMESPAILVAVLLARWSGVGAATDLPKGWEEREGGGMGGLIREAFLNGSVLLLLGSLLIGVLSGEKGWESVAPFAYEPFKGVLCLFLLDMGLIAARRLESLRKSGPLLLAFSLAFPLVSGALAIALAAGLGLGHGDALLFTVLCASASYIAVPAALRSALPQANPSLFLPMSLAVTFPFNITLGIPLYMTLIERFWGPA